MEEYKTPRQLAESIFYGPLKELIGDLDQSDADELIDKISVILAPIMSNEVPICTD